MENVDIVDNNLNILYKISKEEAHKKGLLHKTVIAEIINNNGEMSLVKQNVHKQDAGQFVSPVGGHVSAGESDEDALKREAFEEAGLKNFDYKFKGKMIFDRYVNGHRENHYFIIYEIYCDDNLVINDESIGYKRFKKDDLKNLIKNKPEEFGKAFVVIVEKFYPELL